MNKALQNWFQKKRWEIFPFQRKTIKAFQERQSGLIHSATGTGKTYAIWFAIINRFLNTKLEFKNSGLKVLWITPMRALAKDTLINLQKPIQDLKLNWTIGLRTGDTSSSEKAKQNRGLPHVLITTPESLSLLLSLKNSQNLFKDLECIVVDEWHELMGNKRGVQTQLCLTRLHQWRSAIQTWGLTATMANLSDALENLIFSNNGVIIKGVEKPVPDFEIILPNTFERFPWAGHMGLNNIKLLLPYLEAKNSTLIFVNTRGQAENWYHSLLELKPEWAGIMALHHSSIDKKIRHWVEEALRTGHLKIVICTSSLDLGVDFSPVQQVVQVGSPKSVARLLQRAGRSQHNPTGKSKILLFPTHAFEILEYHAAIKAIKNNHIESRTVLHKPYDVLIQHLLTIACGQGFNEKDMFAEITAAPSYKTLSKKEWLSILEFIQFGGPALTHYPEYKKVIVKNHILLMVDKKIAHRHRMNIGTITSDAMVIVKFQRGKKIATVEENFINKLKKGDIFYLNGKSLEFMHLKDMQAIVKISKKSAKIIPRWIGGRLPLSNLLNQYLQTLLEISICDTKILPGLSDILKLQTHVSKIPTRKQLLVEKIKTKEGFHHFFFPFGGRKINETLAILLAHRLTKIQENTFSLAVNDYGFDLCASKPILLSRQQITKLLSTENLLNDLLESSDATQLNEKQFRDIAKISGLVFSGYPGSQKSMRQIQASSTLLYQVLKKYDPNNILLQQAEMEILSQTFSLDELIAFLKKLQSLEYLMTEPKQLTPFAFPLWVDLQRLVLSNETLQVRIERMLGILNEH